MPVAILQGVAGAASVSAFGMVTDIERGYFDKLLLTPTPRLALVLGRLAADGVRVMLLTALILIVGLIFGAGHGGRAARFRRRCCCWPGCSASAYAGFGLSIALRTGNAQAAQAGFLIFFPLLFLSPAFAPKEIFDGWLKFLATINPVTYILEGMRSLVLDGLGLGQPSARRCCAIGGPGRVHADADAAGAALPRPVDAHRLPVASARPLSEAALTTSTGRLAFRYVLTTSAQQLDYAQLSTLLSMCCSTSLVIV